MPLDQVMTFFEKIDYKTPFTALTMLQTYYCISRYYIYYGMRMCECYTIYVFTALHVAADTQCWLLASSCLERKVEQGFRVIVASKAGSKLLSLG